MNEQQSGPGTVLLHALLEEVRNVCKDLEQRGMPKHPDATPWPDWVTNDLASAYVLLGAAIEGFEAHLQKEQSHE